MGVVKKQGGIATVIIYIGIAIGYLNVAILMPKYFSEEEIGLRALIVDFAIVFNQFVLFGMNAAMQRFYPRFQEGDKDVKGLLSFGLVIPVLLFAIGSLLVFVFQDYILSFYEEKSSIFTGYFYLVYWLTLGFTLTMVLESYCKTFLRIIVPQMLKEVFIRIFFLGCIILFAFDLITLKTFFNLFVAAYFIMTAFLLIYVFIRGKLDFSFNWRVMNKTFLKEVMVFSSFTFLTLATGSLVIKMDTMMIGAMVGIGDVGIYTIAIFIATLVEIPRRSLASINAPLYSKFIAENNHVELSNLYRRTGEILLLAGGFVFAGIVINLQEVYEVIPKGEIYEKGFFVVVFIGLCRVVDMMFSNNSEILAFSKYYKYNLLFLVIMLVLAVVLNYMFINKWGITGASMATLSSFLFYNTVKYFFLKRKMKISPFSVSTLKIIIFLTITAIPCYYISFTEIPLMNILIRSIIFSLTCLAGFCFLGISNEANLIIQQIRDKFIK